MPVNIFKPFYYRSILEKIIRWPKLTVGLMLAITLVFAWHLPQIQFRTSMYDLAVEKLPETEYYESFKKQFGSEEIILVVARTDNIFDPDVFSRIRQMATEIEKIPDVIRVDSLPGIKDDIDLTNKWNLADFENLIAPVDFFRRNFISDDKKTTVIVAVLNDVRHKDRIIQAVKGIIETEKAHFNDLYQIGMPLVADALVEYTRKDFFILPPITFLIILVVLFVLYHDTYSTLIAAGSVVTALVWTFGLMAITHIAISLLTMIVPIFLIAIGTAYCMYILSEFRDTVQDAESLADAVYASFLQVRFPTTLAVCTTMVGLASLLLNRISGIREFALFSCFGMLSLLVIMLSLLPALLAIRSIPPKDNQGRSPINDLLARFLEWIIQVNLRHQKITLPILAGITLVAIAGIFFIRVETNPVDYFKKGTPISKRFYDVYKDMAGSFPVSVVLDSKTDSYFEDPRHLKQIADIQQFLDTLEGVDKTISYADFLKLANYASNDYQVERYALPTQGFEVRMLNNTFKTILGDDVFNRFMNPMVSKTNIVMRTHLASSRDFFRIRDEISAYLTENYSGAFDFHVTGLGMVIAYGSHILTSSQIKSLGMTMVIIFGIMFVLFLSVKVGMIAVLPNLFPIVLNFGLMGWLGIKFSVATSLIASIAIGIAVDDTIHYLVRYNREFKKDLDKDRALADTIRHVGVPILFTSLTISLGFSVLAFSYFKPTAIFGILMVVTMTAAMVADLLLLPALMLHVELITAWDLLRLMPTLGGMSAGMAHELNQPLNAIKMGSEFLKVMAQQGRDIPRDQLEQVVDEIGTQVDRTAEIIKRLSEFTQKSEIKKENVDLNQPVKDTLAIIGHQLTLDNIQWQVEAAPDLPLIRAHANRLGQVVFNLVTNACEAINAKPAAGNEKPERRILIRTYAEAGRVCLSVSDTGAGIAEHIRDRIMEPFFTTKALGKGKGLGLSISNEIVRDYQGRIHVRSTPGEGAQFTVSFPVRKQG